MRSLAGRLEAEDGPGGKAVGREAGGRSGRQRTGLAQGCSGPGGKRTHGRAEDGPGTGGQDGRKDAGSGRRTGIGVGQVKRPWLMTAWTGYSGELTSVAKTWRYRSWPWLVGRGSPGRRWKVRWPSGCHSARRNSDVPSSAAK